MTPTSRAQPPRPPASLGAANQANVTDLAAALEPVVELLRSGRLEADTLAAGILSLAGRPVPDLVDAAQVAELYGVSAAWVRENGARLGGTRLGTGTRPRWRFDLQRVAEVLTPRSTNVRSANPKPPAKTTKRRAPSPRSLGTSPDLLPIRGENPCR